MKSAHFQISKKRLAPCFSKDVDFVITNRDVCSNGNSEAMHLATTNSNANSVSNEAQINDFSKKLK